jgi:hypothetical protein
MVANAVTTSSPSVVRTSLRVVINSLPAATRTPSTATTTCSRSPACTGRACSNRCSPWTTRP